MKRNFPTCTLLACLTILCFLSSCETALPYREITYTPDRGYIVKKDADANPDYYSGSNLMLDREGIGTVVIFDTLRCGGHEILHYETIAQMAAKDFSVTAVGEYNVLLLDRGSGKTWGIDLSQCCVIFRYQATGMVSLFADPKCSGLKIP